MCEEATQYACANSSQCVPLSAHCNDWPDCDDGSDESVDTCPPTVNSVCAAGKWQCEDTTCIDKSSLCDGQADCPGAEDELACSKSLPRSEEHTSELQSHVRISYAVFCLKKKKK